MSNTQTTTSHSQARKDFINTAKENAKRRIRNYSGVELSGKDIFNQLNIDYAGGN